MRATSRRDACYYQVELSGLDQWGRSFSELATLEWSPETGKVLHSHRKVTAGATIFLRLLLWQGRNALPLPYRVTRVVQATRTSWSVYLTPLENNSDVPAVGAVANN